MKNGPCTNCGKCCSNIPCGIGLALLGDYRPCAALEKHGDGKHYCGLYLHSGKYLNLGIFFRKWKERFVKQLIAEYCCIGIGCNHYLPTDTVFNEIKANGLFKKKWKKVKAGSRQSVEF